MKQCCNNYCVIRVFPDTTFIEAIGTKKVCMKFAQGAAKPGLRVCKMVPVVKWNNSGQMKEIGK